MKILLLFLFSILSVNLVHANTGDVSCKISTGELEWAYQGYPINFSSYVLKILDEKGYTRVQSREDASTHLEIKMAVRPSKHFEFATAAFFWSDATGNNILDFEREKMCWTQACGITDFIKPLRAVIAELDSRLPNCASSLGL